MTALALTLLAPAPAVAKSVNYRPVKGRLTITNQVQGTFPNGDIFGGESTETFKGGAGKNAVLTIGGPGDFYAMAFPARYTYTGFEMVQNSTGGTDDCSGALPAFSSGANIGVFLTRTGKRKFDAEWSNVQPSVPSDDCGFSEDPEAGPARVIEHETGKLGSPDELELKTKGTLDYAGQNYFHTLSWDGRVVVKKGGAVSG